MNFGNPPEDLDYSIPLEPMRMQVIGDQQDALRELLTDLVDTHRTKLTKLQRDDLRSTYRLLLLNVIYNSISRIYTAVPRGARSFAKGTYWDRCGLTYKLTIAALNRLVEDGLVHQYPGFYNRVSGLSRLTRIFGADKLAEKVDLQKVVESVDFGWQEDATSVVLKGFPYAPDDLGPDHPDVSRLREINSFLKEHRWQQRGPVRIIYKDNPLSGGRVYTRFQNLPKEFRLGMKIDGKEVVELDYKSNHLMMLIAMKGQQLPPDPYAVISEKARLSREQVKTFVTVSSGASSEVSARRALGKKGMTREQFNKIRDAVDSSFPGVPLFRGFGTLLQSLEGQIALDIMVAGARAGIVVLPVHDSFITAKGNEAWLLNEMVNQWSIHVGDDDKQDLMTKVEKK